MGTPPKDKKGRYTLKDETGNRFGRLLVIHKAADETDGKWVCCCDCGNEKVVRGVNLRKGRVKSCGCLRRERPKQLYTKPNNQSLWNSVVSAYRNGAAKRSLLWDIETEVAISLMRGDCYFCGSPPTNQMKRSNGSFITYNGIDRLDNALGYITTNVVSCCKTCNFGKRTMTTEEFLRWIHKVAANTEAPT